jgi:hypothetical protein
VIAEVRDLKQDDTLNGRFSCHKTGTEYLNKQRLVLRQALIQSAWIKQKKHAGTLFQRRHTEHLQDAVSGMAIKMIRIG